MAYMKVYSFIEYKKYIGVPLFIEGLHVAFR